MFLLVIFDLLSSALKTVFILISQILGNKVSIPVAPAV